MFSSSHQSHQYHHNHQHQRISFTHKTQQGPSGVRHSAAAQLHNLLSAAAAAAAAGDSIGSGSQQQQQEEEERQQPLAQELVPTNSSSSSSLSSSSMIAGDGSSGSHGLSPAAMDAIGYTGGCVLAICLIPQIGKIVITRSARDISYAWSVLYLVGVVVNIIF
jgi:hypothetical protein